MSATAWEWSSWVVGENKEIIILLLSAGQQCWGLLPYLGNLPRLPAAVCPYSQQKPAHPHWYQGCGPTSQSHTRYSFLFLSWMYWNNVVKNESSPCFFRQHEGDPFYWNPTRKTQQRARFPTCIAFESVISICPTTTSVVVLNIVQCGRILDKCNGKSLLR